MILMYEFISGGVMCEVPPSVLTAILVLHAQVASSGWWLIASLSRMPYNPSHLASPLPRGIRHGLCLECLGSSLQGKWQGRVHARCHCQVQREWQWLCRRVQSAYYLQEPVFGRHLEDCRCLASRSR